MGTGADPSLALQTTIVGNEDTYTLSNGGVYLFGIVSPPGLGVDNNSSDPATGEWNIDITRGPFFPAASGGIYTGSNEIPGDGI